MTTTEIDKLCKDLKGLLTINLDNISDNIIFEEGERSPRVGFSFISIININRKRKLDNQFETRIEYKSPKIKDNSPKIENKSPKTEDNSPKLHDNSTVLCQI